MSAHRRIGAVALVVSLSGVALFPEAAEAGPDCTKLSCADPSWKAACASKGATNWCAPGGGDDRLKKATPAAQTTSISPIGTAPAPKPVFRMPTTVQIAPKTQPSLPAKSTLVPAGTPAKTVAPGHPAVAADGYALPGRAVDTRHLVVGGTIRRGGVRGLAGPPEGANAKADFIIKGMDVTKVFGDDPAQRLAKEKAAMKNRRPSVGDPLTFDYHHPNPADPSLRVQSCDDYVYKKYFEYNWFVDTVQALGTDYRAIFDVATRVDSPVRITRPLKSFGPDVPPQMMDISPYGNVLEPLVFDFENTQYAHSAGAAISASTEITNWNAFYAYFDMLGTPLSKTVSGVRGAPIPLAQGGVGVPVWQGVVYPSTKWFDLAMKLEKSHAAMSDGELEWGAARSAKLTALTTQLRQVIWSTASAYCKAHYAGSVPTINSDIPGNGMNNLVCLARKDGAPIIVLKPVGSSVQGQKGKLVTAKDAGNTGQPGTSGTMDTHAVPDLTNNAAVLIIKADIDAAVAFEKTLLQTNPKQSCLNPDPMVSACTWSYRKFAGILQEIENDTIYHATHGDSGKPVAALAGPSFDLAKCKRYVPDFDVILDLHDPYDAKLPIKYTANNKIFDQVIPGHKLWFSAYQPTLPDGSVYPPGPNSKAFERGHWAKDWTTVEAFFREHDIAAARWAKYEADRVLYLGEVATLANNVQNLPGASNTIGQGSADGFDVGNPDLFGASAHYHLSWVINPMASTGMFPNNLRTNSPLSHKTCAGLVCGDEKYACRYNGAMSAGADAAASVLGGSISILDTGFASWAKDDAVAGGQGAHMDAHFSFLGSEIVPDPLPGGINQSSTGQFNITTPVAEKDAQVPDPPFEVDFAIGPVPVSLQAGLVLSAGIDLSTTGQIGDTCNQKLPNYSKGDPGMVPAGTAVELPVVPPQFALTSTLDPWVKVDGFAQAGVDLVFVQAGVRIDLTVIKMGIPVSVGVSVAKDPLNKRAAMFNTQADVTFESLSGALSAFVEVNYLVGSATFEQEIFSWDGLHASKPLFAYNKQYDIEGLNYRLNKPAYPMTSFTQMRQ